MGGSYRKRERVARIVELADLRFVAPTEPIETIMAASHVRSVVAWCASVALLISLPCALAAALALVLAR